MMELTMEWNVICRICLQEGPMHSIFETDKGMLISEKIMMCSNLKISQGQNLPEQICSCCLDELNVAYNFRSNCESSNAVLEAFAKGDIVNDLVVCSVKGKVYKYEPPAGLNVKRIRKSTTPPPMPDEEPEIDDNIIESVSPKIELHEIDEIQEEEFIASDEFSDIILEQPDMPMQYEVTEVDESSMQDELVFFPEKLQTFVKKTSSASKKNNSTQKSTRSKGEKPLCICELCGNIFKYKHALETHMRRHRNEKPFACEICGRAFVLNVELTCHMRTHTGQKPYACRFCDRRFSDFGSRIKHERSHTGERPYACDTCGKAFAYSYGLSSHILTHTGEKPHKCEKCGKRFTKKHHLTNHLKTHSKQEQKLRAQMIEEEQSKDQMIAIPIEYHEQKDRVLPIDDEVTLIDGGNSNDFEEYDEKPMLIFDGDSQNL